MFQFIQVLMRILRPLVTFSGVKKVGNTITCNCKKSEVVMSAFEEVLLNIRDIWVDVCTYICACMHACVSECNTTYVHMHCTHIIMYVALTIKD